MAIVGFDGVGNVFQGHVAEGVLGQRLGLNAAQNRSPTAFVAVGVRGLSDDVFITALAMRHQSTQITLRARGHEKRSFKTQHCCKLFLQRIDARVVAEHIVAQGGLKHRLAHRSSGLGDGVAAKINGFLHLRPYAKKFFSIAWPCSVRMLSG